MAVSSSAAYIGGAVGGGVGGLILLGAAAYFILRRRRRSPHVELSADPPNEIAQEVTYEPEKKVGPRLSELPTGKEGHEMFSAQTTGELPAHRSDVQSWELDTDRAPVELPAGKP